MQTRNPPHALWEMGVTHTKEKNRRSKTFTWTKKLYLMDSKPRKIAADSRWRDDLGGFSGKIYQSIAQLRLSRKDLWKALIKRWTRIDWFQNRKGRSVFHYYREMSKWKHDSYKHRMERRINIFCLLFSRQ